MEVTVKIDNLVGSGPFKITWGGYVQNSGGPDEIHYLGDDSQNTLVESVERWQLLSGFTFSALDGITRIRVSEKSPCGNFVNINILSEPGDEIVADPGYNVKIVGSAIPVVGGYTMVRSDVNKYTITGAFVNGNAQFDIDDGTGGISYGETNFPTGTLGGNSDLIPVVAGNYIVTVEIDNGNYSFS